MLVMLCVVHFSGRITAADIPKPKLKLKPSILHGSAEDVTAPALKYDTSWRYNGDLGVDDDLAVVLESKGAVATDARANSQNLYAAFHLGYSHQFADWEMVASTNRTSERPNARPVMYKRDKLGGLFDLFLKARFETDQSLENYQVTYGPHLGFSPTGREGFSWLVPACYVDYQRVDILHSQRNQQLGVNDDSFWRLDASAGWRLPVGDEFFTEIRWLRPVELEFDLHYYRAFELPAGAAAADLDEAWYYEGTLLYNLRALDPESSAWPWWKPYAAYLSVGHGRQPPAPREQTSVSVGVAYSWGN